MGICLGKKESKGQNETKNKTNSSSQNKLQISKEMSQIFTGKSNFISDQDYFYSYDAWYEKDHYKGELLFSKNLFIKLYQNYSAIQQSYMKNFQDITLEMNPLPVNQSIEKLSTHNIMFKLRYLIRRGCNVALIRTLIKNKFRVGWESFSEKYEVMKTVVFEHSSSSDVRLVPTFSQHTLQQLIQVHCLNKVGESALKRILWVIRENYPKLEYNPMIVQVATISLIFFNEYETYLVLKTMIDDSALKLDEKKQINQEIMKDLRWYFTLSSADYKKNAKLFFDVARIRSSEFSQIIEFLDSKNFDYIQQFIEWTTHFFLNILKFSTVLRIWTIYLNEGIRTLYKITFGIWITIKDDIKQFETADEIKEFLKSIKIDKTLEEVDQLFVTSYRLKIKKINKFFREIKNSSHSPQLKIIYRPRTKEKSKIITYQHFEAIWDWIPSSFKISNPTMIYSTFKDGYSLQTLYQKAEQHITKPMLLLIKTTHQTFGIFSEVMVQIGHSDSFYGTEDIFLFTLEPKEIAFMPTGQNQDYIQSNRQQISFGTGPDGYGLLIKENLTGQSTASETFDNLPLHGDFNDKNFRITNIELYCLSN